MDHLEFGYLSKIGKKGNTKQVIIEDNDELLNAGLGVGGKKG